MKNFWFWVIEDYLKYFFFNFSPFPTFVLGPVSISLSLHSKEIIKQKEMYGSHLPVYKTIGQQSVHFVAGEFFLLLLRISTFFL